MKYALAVAKAEARDREDASFHEVIAIAHM